MLLPGEKVPELSGEKSRHQDRSGKQVRECAPIFANLPQATVGKVPLTMEQYDQGQGCILYRTTIPAGEAATLEAAAVHDFGFAFLDGKSMGVMDRRNNSFKIKMPARAAAATLDILVEAVGRVNFGEEVHDRKGICAPIKLDGNELSNWKVFSLPLDKKMLEHLRFEKANNSGPAFWRATVNVEKPGDTFLDLRPWGKGGCLGQRSLSRPFLEHWTFTNCIRAGTLVENGQE